MLILSIETSCDDTCLALIEAKPNNQKKDAFRVVFNLVSSQIKVHAPYGGIVPNLAKREHQNNLVLLLNKGLKKLSDKKKNKKEINLTKQKNNKLTKILNREKTLLKKLKTFLKSQKKIPQIDSIAVTIGPGLEPALWTGVNLAKVLSYLWQIPIIPINHLEGHITANWLKFSKEKDQFRIINSKKILPAVCLIISGGHTQLVLIKKYGSYELLGETLDDAVGEAFDKVARMLKLGYPGGPAIAEISARHKNKKTINIQLPRPMLNSKNLNFSFSGLKTAVLYSIKELTKKYPLKEIKSSIAIEFQQAVIDVLTSKIIQAAEKTQVKTLMLSGGVASNLELRKQLKAKINKQFKLLIPPPYLCTDNALMIAAAAYFHLQKNEKMTPWSKIAAQANLRL